MSPISEAFLFETSRLLHFISDKLYLSLLLILPWSCYWQKKSLVFFSIIIFDDHTEPNESDFKNLATDLGNLAYTSGQPLQQVLMSVGILLKVVMDS